MTQTKNWIMSLNGHLASATQTKVFLGQQIAGFEKEETDLRATYQRRDEEMGDGRVSFPTYTPEDEEAGKARLAALVAGFATVGATTPSGAGSTGKADVNMTATSGKKQKLAADA